MGWVLIVSLFMLILGGIAGYIGKQIEKLREPKDGKPRWKDGKWYDGKEWK